MIKRYLKALRYKSKVQSDFISLKEAKSEIQT